jgi:hypothetical protein
MFVMFVAPARGIDRPRRRGGHEPSFWRGLALMGSSHWLGWHYRCWRARLPPASSSRSSKRADNNDQPVR